MLPCVLVLLTAFASAQSEKQPPAAGGQVLHLTLGQSAFPLNGPWKFTVGDSPIDPRTGQPLWAEPEFDDSHWENVDLTAPKGTVDPIAGISG
jgi:hypothetical protein